MPFVKTYAVNFANNNNLDPHVNLKGWPAMLLSTPTPNDLADRSLDDGGLNLKITRGLAVPAQSAAQNSVYVVPPDGLSLDTRLFMRITFDRPQAEGLSKNVQDPPGRHPETNTVPEPWAVALNVSPAPNVLNAPDSMVNVTCQFSRGQNSGVRLNTPKDPRGFGSLQTDPAANLESPLNYENYNSELSQPIFTLTNSFCGWNSATNGHTAGSGSLKIFRGWVRDHRLPQHPWREPDEVKDHRVYSNNSFQRRYGSAQGIEALGQGIEALGMSLVTLSGQGIMSVRLRTFELWFNPGVPELMDSAFAPLLND